LSLSLAGALFTEGARLLNPYRSCALTQNKIVVARLLREAGVAAPRSWVTYDYELLRPVLEETPLVIKPYMGHRGAGVHIVRTQDDLSKVPEPEVPMIVQELIEGDGEDTKVYVVRDQVFAVRKAFSEESFTQVGRPVPVSDAIRTMAIKTGEACGLALYGLDIIESEGVPDVAPLIADCIDDYAQGRFTLAPPEARVARGESAD